MAVELKDLYAEIQPIYGVKLHTHSCFGKVIGWIHTAEGPDFAPLLGGDELIFNSGLHYTSDKWLKDFIDVLVRARAGGLIVSLHDGKEYPQEIIDYCNQIKFPLFSASRNTPYIDIVRMFSEILLRNEQRDTNLTTALKNAIYYPQNEEVYLSHFESSGFFRDMEYVVVVLSCHAYDTEKGNETLEEIEKRLHHMLRSGIVYKEKGRLIILIAGARRAQVENEVRKLCSRDDNIYAGIGPIVENIWNIHQSYEKAYTAYQLTKTAIPTNILHYDELGVYKILADGKDSSLYKAFVEETLGRLLEYDREKGTGYMDVLEAYFDHECSILETSQALYCHKNTLSYKLNKIKDILGHDILTNENRTKIMLSFYIMRLGTP